MARIYKYNDRTGERIGLLTIFKRIKDKNPKGEPIWAWICICDCGKQKIVPAYSLNAGTRSCGCITNKSRKLPPGEKPKRDLLHGYKQSAEIRKIKFELTMKQFEELTKQNCFYCGETPLQIRVNNKDKNDMYTYNGIDRVDNKKGYLISNCVACCKICNYAKREMSKEDFSKWISKVYSHLNTKSISL